MKKKLVLLLSVVLVMISLLCACGSSSYEQDLDSGMDKFINGNMDSASDSEKNAVNDFLEWQSEQD